MHQKGFFLYKERLFGRGRDEVNCCSAASPA
jgi:hypothetical protein